MRNSRRWKFSSGADGDLFTRPGHQNGTPGPVRCYSKADQCGQNEYKSTRGRNVAVQNESMRVARCAVLLLGLVWGFTGVCQAQTVIASSPDPSAGVQYVAPICTGGSPCTNLNDGLSAGSAKWDTDAGKAIDDAYAALPPTGGVIYLLSFGGCSDFSTPIDLNTKGKYVTIIGAGINTTCLNYTPSTGTAFTLTTGGAGAGQNDRLENFSLISTTIGSTATGLAVGYSGPGPALTKLDGISVNGFQNDVIDDTYGLVMTNTDLLSCSSAPDSVAFQTGNSGPYSGDDTRISSSDFSNCATLITVDPGNVNPIWATGLILAGATSISVDLPTGGLYCDRCHWVNRSGTANWFSNSGGFLIATNSQFEDDSSSGTATSYATITAGFTIITNSLLYSGGHTVTEFIHITGGHAYLSNFANTTPQLIPKLTNGYSDGFAETVLSARNLVPGHVLVAEPYGPSQYVGDGGGPPVLQGANGISAGSCTISGGECSHTFAKPYTAAPVCTVTSGSASAANIVTSPVIFPSATTVNIADTGAPDGTIMNWICYPASN